MFESVLFLLSLSNGLFSPLFFNSFRKAFVLFLQTSNSIWTFDLLSLIYQHWSSTPQPLLQSPRFAVSSLSLYLFYSVLSSFSDTLCSKGLSTKGDEEKKHLKILWFFLWFGWSFHGIWFPFFLCFCFLSVFLFSSFIQK
jgi:hypothetical protein